MPREPDGGTTRGLSCAASSGCDCDELELDCEVPPSDAGAPPPTASKRRVWRTWGIALSEDFSNFLSKFDAPEKACIHQTAYTSTDRVMHLASPTCHIGHISLLTSHPPSPPLRCKNSGKFPEFALFPGSQISVSISGNLWNGQLIAERGARRGRPTVA